jgi:hypothetical protein
MASDGVYVLVAYQLGDNSVEFQTAPKSGIGASLTHSTTLGTVKNIGPRRQMKLVGAGKAGAFLLVSVVAKYSSVGALLGSEIYAETTTNGGKTWSAPRPIRLGATLVTFDSYPQVTVDFTSEWIVIWNEDTTSVGAGTGSDLLMSTSLNGQVWTSPDIVLNGNNTNYLHPNLYVTGPQSFMIAYDQDGTSAGVVVASCPLNTANFGEALTSGSNINTNSMFTFIVTVFVSVIVGFTSSMSS